MNEFNLVNNYNVIYSDHGVVFQVQSQAQAFLSKLDLKLKFEYFSKSSQIKPQAFL